MTDYHLPPSLEQFEISISGWLAAFAEGNELFEAIDRGDPTESNEPRWYVRLRGEAKEHITIWLTLGQRTLRYEAYVLPAPQENVAEVFEWVSANMPDNDPGGLKKEDYADVLAYILAVNAYPVGAADMPADRDTLKQYEIVSNPK